MAAAYAAVLSLMQTINHLRIHPRPPISLQQQHLHLLTQNLAFLQDFLERCYTQDDAVLEGRITAAAYAAEDLIESHVVDQIQARSISHGAAISSSNFNLELERVIHDLDLVKDLAMEKMGTLSKEKLHRNSSDSVASVRPAFTRQISIKAGFDDAMIIQLLDELTGRRKNLEIISIVGMGGIGKTTLARNIYQNPLIQQHFDYLAWVTVSQVYSGPQILLQALCDEGKGSDLSDHELGDILHKKLWGRRYLIVMDDIWSIEAWYKVKLFLADCNNGSRIMTTTRLSNLALELSGSDHAFQMKFLNDNKSWELLREIVFDTVDCPSELENIGKEIARNCRGLPLSIVVIGGLLAKSNSTKEYWEYTLENLSSIINLDDNQHCLQILETSYKELPMHLKPCFLYMGIFVEDEEIPVSYLIKWWIAEGFLRPVDGKCVEEVAEEFLKELIDRNLVLVEEFRWNGEVKKCKIHDLLLDLCLRVGKEERFLCIQRAGDANIQEDINMERRICIRGSEEEAYSPQLLHALESASLPRTLIPAKYCPQLLQSGNFRLLRVYLDDFDEDGEESEFISYAEVVFQKVNLRCLMLVNDLDAHFRMPLALSKFWNLQIVSLTVTSESKTAPSEIWEMALLRHALLLGFQLPDPPHHFVLDNLHTLEGINNFKCSKEVVERIPNINKLKLFYEEEDEVPNLNFTNLDHLSALKSFSLYIVFDLTPQQQLLVSQNLALPCSLKKLTLQGTMLTWEELTTKIGSLPLLQCLKLNKDACRGSKWETIEGQFSSLRFLNIFYCSDLERWETEDTHFPSLMRLYLFGMPKLEIPSCIGDIPTLKSIELCYCGQPVVDSARRIKQEQEDYGNELLQFQIQEDRRVEKVREEEEDEVVTEWEEKEEETEEEEGQAISDWDRVISEWDWEDEAN